MRLLLVLASLLSILAAGTVCAASLHGQDDPRFQAALALWLAEDEKTALPELAALSAEGNRAAQVLLATIDVTPSFQGPWLAGLPRADRNALLRAPGGLSGRSWMQAAAEDTPLARLSLVQPATAETALAFAELGEHRAARDILRSLAQGQYRDFAAMADHPNYPPEMRYLIWREWTDDPATRPRAEAEMAALHPGDPQLANYDSRPLDPVAFDDWLASAPLAAPLRAPCESACPGSVRSCTRAGYEFLSSFSPAVVVSDSGYRALLVRGSPWETIIPSEVWNASPRARAVLVRLYPHDAEAILARVAATDACFAATMAEEAARLPK